jgi:CRP-like cAMP-binding protein
VNALRGPGRDAVTASPLLAGLADEQVDRVLAACERREHPAGTELLAAGHVSSGIQFIESGTAEVMLATGTAVAPVVVARLAPGQAFGELSALTGSPAISTVRSAEPVRLRILTGKALAGMHESAAITNTLLRNVIRTNQQRLSDTNASYVRQLERSVELARLRNASARLFILVLLLMCITILTNHWLTLKPGVDVYSPAFAWTALVILVLPTLAFAWRERYPLAAMGITTRHLWRDLGWSLVIIVAVLVSGGVALLFSGYPLAERFRLDYLVAYGPTYALHSALQEFMGRGVLLGMMLRIYESHSWRQRQFSNLAVSMMFALTHIHFGLAAVGISLAFSLLLGSYYMVHRNLAGPTLIHAVLGIAAFMFGLI